MRARVPDADPEDLLLFDDLLGIADPDVPLPKIDPDARRRRLTVLIKAVALANTEPALYIIDDAQWVDEVSESMLTDFLAVIPQIPAMVLITSRPEYQGALRRVPDAQTIALGPLSDSDTAALVGELLGSDPSVSNASAAITERAAGNPFFTEEMVREMVQRGVLAGERGGYVCHADVTDVGVPATVQAAIAARIDRLNSRAKRTLNAASVIGARFGTQLLTTLENDPVVDELVTAELIDQVTRRPGRRIRLPTPIDPRGGLRIAAEIRSRRGASAAGRGHRTDSPQSADQNAALIAGHLEAAGNLRAAYAWHMRAGAWSTNRDIAAARVSWERARRIADALPADDPERTAMRIAPRTMLCGAGWRVDAHIAGHFDGAAGVMCARRRQGVAGHRHDRHGDGSHDAEPACGRRRGWRPNSWRCSRRSAIQPLPLGSGPWRSS